MPSNTSTNQSQEKNMQAMISRITQEVVSRLRAESGPISGGNTPPPWAVAGRPASANANVNTTSVSGSVGSSSVPVNGAGKNALVILTGGHDVLDTVMEQLRIIGRQSKNITLVMSKSAQGLMNIESIRSLLRPNRLITATFYEDIDELLDQADIVYIPILSLNSAVKAMQLVGDNLPTILISMAILRGMPIVASKSSIYWSPASPTTAPAAANQYIDEMLRKLTEYGIVLVDIGQLAAASGAGSGTIPSGSSSSSCSASAGGECNGCGQCVEQQPSAVKNLINSGAARIGATSGVKVADPAIANMIDHTLLKPDATREQIEKLCDEAKQYHFASVCVNPSYVSLAAQLLKGTDVKVCTVIGFPLGATTSTTKAIETRDAIANGATEIDMVINVGALKSGDDELVRRDIAAVVDAARGGGIVKVILETALLSREEKIKGCLLAKMAGADFVKTSTGFGPGGATVEDIALMRETIGPEMGVKASGGVRDLDTARAMVAAGATRIGASASVAIATGAAPKAAVKGY